jgi:hypothetical protein
VRERAALGENRGEHDAQDRLAGDEAGREQQTGADFGDEVGREGKVSEERVGKTATSGLEILRRGKTDPFRGSWKLPALKARLDLEFRAGRVYITGRAKTENGNAG